MELKQLRAIDQCHTALSKPIHMMMADGKLEEAQAFMQEQFQQIHEESAEAIVKAAKRKDFNVLYNHVKLLQTTVEELRDVEDLIKECPPGSDERRGYQEQSIRSMYDERELNIYEFRQMMVERGFDPDKEPVRKGLGDLIAEALKSHSEDCPIHGTKRHAH